MSAKCTVEHCTYCLLQDFVYPENVAYPIGGPGNARFLVMEMHYDNPDMNSGMLDFQIAENSCTSQSCLICAQYVHWLVLG